MNLHRYSSSSYWLLEVQIFQALFIVVWGKEFGKCGTRSFPLYRGKYTSEWENLFLLGSFFAVGKEIQRVPCQGRKYFYWDDCGWRTRVLRIRGAGIHRRITVARVSWLILLVASCKKNPKVIPEQNLQPVIWRRLPWNYYYREHQTFCSTSKKPKKDFCMFMIIKFIHKEQLNTFAAFRISLRFASILLLIRKMSIIK